MSDMEFEKPPWKKRNLPIRDDGTTPASEAFRFINSAEGEKEFQTKIMNAYDPAAMASRVSQHEAAQRKLENLENRQMAERKRQALHETLGFIVKFSKEKRLKRGGTFEKLLELVAEERRKIRQPKMSWERSPQNFESLDKIESILLELQKEGWPQDANLGKLFEELEAQLKYIEQTLR